MADDHVAARAFTAASTAQCRRSRAHSLAGASVPHHDPHRAELLRYAAEQSVSNQQRRKDAQVLLRRRLVALALCTTGNRGASDGLLRQGPCSGPVRTESWGAAAHLALH